MLSSCSNNYEIEEIFADFLIKDSYGIYYIALHMLQMILRRLIQRLEMWDQQIYLSMNKAKLKLQTCSLGQTSLAII